MDGARRQYLVAGSIQQPATACEAAREKAGEQRSAQSQRNPGGLFEGVNRSANWPHLYGGCLNKYYLKGCGHDSRKLSQ
jgi:hypothetical protein